MKIAIISDIEANDKKLIEVLQQLSECNYIFNLGDSIGDKGNSDRVIQPRKYWCTTHERNSIQLFDIRFGFIFIRNAHNQMNFDHEFIAAVQ